MTQLPASTVSLVIPAYNEAERIIPSLETVAAFAAEWPQLHEVVVVHDGGTDQTAPLVSEFVERPDLPCRFRLLEYGQNRGKGFAVRYGFENVTGDYFAFSDTDLSAPIDQLPILISELEAGADVAIASRRLSQSEVIGLPLKRRLMGWVFSTLSRSLVISGIHDTQCGFKAYRSEVARDLVSQQQIEGFTFDVEHLLLARQAGYRVSEVPVRWIYADGSQVHGLRDSVRMFRDLLRLRRICRYQTSTPAQSR